MPRSHPLYNVWLNMRRRCNEPDNKSYKTYGGRGIRVCEEWNDSFDAFLRDIPEYVPGMTMNRIDNDGNYEPGNIEWVDIRSQCNNRSSNVYFEIDGETKTLAEWGHHYKLSATGYKRAHERIKNGWDPKLALETPPRKGNWARSVGQTES